MSRFVDILSPWIELAMPVDAEAFRGRVTAPAAAGSCESGEAISGALSSPHDESTSGWCSHPGRIELAGIPVQRGLHPGLLWLVGLLVLISGSALAGECANPARDSNRNLIYSDCEAGLAGSHLTIRIDKSVIVGLTIIDESVFSTTPARGGPTPYLQPAHYGLYLSSAPDPCSQVGYPLNGMQTGSLTADLYVCAVASESNTAGGREQRISGKWVAQAPDYWEGLRMTDSGIPWTLGVSSTGSGLGSISGGGPFRWGDTVTLTANANVGSTFVGWSGDAVCAPTFTMPDADTSCIASFMLNSHLVSVGSTGSGSGSTDGGGVYDFGATVNLVAFADLGSDFSGWSGHPLCAASFTMPDEPVSCTANFTLRTYDITTSVNPSGAGTIVCMPNPVGYDQNSDCVASASTGYSFVDFGGDCSGPSCALTSVTSPLSVMANFSLNSHDVTTGTAGAGSGTTGGDGSYTFGSTVTLTATPATGSNFAGWSGDPLCAASFIMPDHLVTCTATFSLNTLAVTTSTTGNGSGTTGGDGNYLFGSTVTLTAMPAIGSSFAGWSGDPLCAASSFTMPDRPVACTATFTLNTHAVTTSMAGTGVGTSGGDGSFPFGSTVTLTATPSFGSSFSGWSGDPLCSASFTMPDHPVACTATFTLNSYAISTAASPASAGSVICAPNPVPHGGDSHCEATPTPEDGYGFAGFIGDCSAAVCDLLGVTENLNVTAQFSSITGITLPTMAGSDAMLSVSGDGCRISAGQFMSPSAGAPSGVTFPYGLVDFTLKGCAAVAVVTITFVEPVARDATYWKETGGVFSLFPATITGNRVTFMVQDNGPGDSDPAIGIIRDPSGVAVGLRAAAIEGPAAISTLSPWSLFLLVGLLGLAVLWRPIRP